MTQTAPEKLRDGHFYWWLRQMPWTKKSFTFDKRCLVRCSISNDAVRSINELDAAGDPSTHHYVEDIAEFSTFHGPIVLPELSKDSSKQGRFS